ncbi:membrane protein insertase [Sulfuricaulis limicola]|uniref:Membrane protein insertase YidC n=1 Tax=Sulfuricaulis limicola TaxID=1620215 RepID=A0A1B4XJW1_9GAMM|nr:membrane protein insertase YidC [Sulfuricaulis limicola]BAV35086.1 membrane protein insertase [Sulfuricaulis limicola]
MDNQRLFLFFALAMVLMLIWQAWEQHNVPPPVPASTTAPGAPAPATAPGVPQAPVTRAAEATAATPKPAEVLASGARIQVRTDVMDAVIDSQGGDVRELSLRQYPVALDKPAEAFPLMRDAGPELFIAQSGLIGLEGQYPTHRTLFTAEATRYTLADAQNELRVPLSWRAPDGVRYTKTYIFRRGSYVVDVEFAVMNDTRREWTGYLYGQFQRMHTATTGIFSVAPSYTGGAIYTPENKYEKIPLDKMAEKPLKREVTGGWVAMLQHYFVGSWMPAPDQRNEFYTDVPDGTRHVLGFKNLNPTKIAPGGNGVIRASMYAGPKEQKILKTLPAEGMNLTVDYGFLTVISAPLFWLLSWLHRLLGNWGWAIILLTVLIKAVFYPLSAKSYKSMAHMRKMQPKMAALKERYGDDRQKLNQAMMELYKTEKINPLGGCLPILIQIPVFLALYWVLLESVEMRQAPWVLWIKDLSSQDPYYILPIIMGASMFVQQKLNPQPLDPIQQKVFMVMPFMFTAMFLFFPAGLVLYWTVNNILSIAQQWRITRVVEGKK